MRTQRLPRRGLAAFGSISFLFAVVAAGCSGGGGSGSSSSASLTPNLTSPTPGFQCASGAGGIAYIPDGGAGGGTGLRIFPFETTNNQFTANCASRMLTTSASLRAFTAGAAGFGIAVAVPGSGTSGYIGFSGLTTGGSPAAYPFFTSSDPSPFGAVGSSATTATSLALLPRGTFAFAVGADASETAGLTGVNNLLSLQPPATPAPTGSPAPSASPTFTPAPNATPTAYNPAAVDPSKVTYVSIGVDPSASPTVSPSTALAVPTASTGRTSIALGPDGTSMLVRGDRDLMGLSIVPTAAGYYVLYPAAGTTVPITTDAALANGLLKSLAYAPTSISPGLYPKGLIAFSPTSGSRVLIGGTSSDAKKVSLLTAVPTDLTVSGTYTAANDVTSLAVNRNGDLAAVGTSGGIEIIAGVGGSALRKIDQTITTPINYTTVGATSKMLGKVLSVGFSPDGGTLLVLADNGDSTASLLAFRFNSDTGLISSPNSGSSSPATLGSPIPAPQGDYMVVR